MCAFMTRILHTCDGVMWLIEIRPFIDLRVCLHVAQSTIPQGGAEWRPVVTVAIARHGGGSEGVFICLVSGGRPSVPQSI